MADAYLRGVDRDQELLLPSRVEDYVSPQSEVRVIHAFAEGMSSGREDGALPVERMMGTEGGRRGYAPRDMAKLFIWGYLNKVRSSRELERACRTNLEAIWLMRDLRPDHCSISRFRAAHARRIKGWLKEFNLIVAQAGLFGGQETAVDGALLKAVNGKARNFTLAKLDALLAKLDERATRYLGELEANDAAEEAAAAQAGPLEEKIAKVKALQEHYRNLRRQAVDSPTGQVSLTDADAVLLKKNAAAGTAIVGFNAQSAVDGKHHLISAVEVTNASHDKGQLAAMMKAACEATGHGLPDSCPLPLPQAEAQADTGAPSGGEPACAPKCLADARHDPGPPGKSSGTRGRRSCSSAWQASQFPPRAKGERGDRRAQATGQTGDRIPHHRKVCMTSPPASPHPSDPSGATPSRAVRQTYLYLPFRLSVRADHSSSKLT